MCTKLKLDILSAAISIDRRGGYFKQIDVAKAMMRQANESKFFAHLASFLVFIHFINNILKHLLLLINTITSFAKSQVKVLIC